MDYNPRLREKSALANAGHHDGAGILRNTLFHALAESGEEMINIDR